MQRLKPDDCDLFDNNADAANRNHRDGPVNSEKHTRFRDSLQGCREELGAIAAHAPDAVLVIDECGTILYANPPCDELLAVTGDEAIGRNGLMQVHEDDLAKVKANIKALFDHPGTSEQFTFRFRKPDGGTVFLESNGSAFVTRLGKLRGVIHMRKLARQLNSESMQDLQSVIRLAGDIGYHFNKLLSLIVANIQQVNKQVREPDLLASIGKALESGLQGQELNRRLLAFSSRQFLEPCAVDVNDLLQTMEPAIKTAFGQDIVLDIQCGKGTWLTKSDPAQLENALLALATNARDSIADTGTVVIATENYAYTGTLEQPCIEMASGDYVRISVEDTGHGMPHHVALRAIQPFFSTRDSEHATGLGLSMVYGFVKQSGGGLQIKSDAGIGTTISIFLPRDPAEPGESLRPEPTDCVQRASRTVLVVDDDRGVRDATAATLRGLGYLVISAVDSRHALNILLSDSIDLVVCSVTEPGLSGLDLARLTQKHRPNTRFLLTVGNDDSIDDTADVGLSSSEILNKHHTRQELAIRVRNLLEARKHA